ncbi:MAG: restriction endonuclease subunit S [Ignavibacteriales bacterium]|nr:restriction endonuclease subunit S [Ignavibacteriales bacterium]
MRSNYKKLGNYIREVNVRNSTAEELPLLGINIDKFFMPSVANIVGTDLSTYKLVKTSQFACNRMHVGRDERLPVALSNSPNNFIVSPAYDVFEIIDQDILLPEYLMMWFSRGEYDRNAWFYTDADVRGGLHWDAFCEMTLPIPHPDKQKEIVKEYNTIVNRINLNNQLIQKLEETAQAIYKQWFVDFEFPDENGNPYKSSGGEMVFNEELEKEIPKGWDLKIVGDIVDCNYATLSSQDDYETIEYLDTSSITNNEIEIIQILNPTVDEIPSRAKRKVNHNDIIFSTVRPNLKHFGILKNPKSNMIVSTGFAVLKPTYPNVCGELVYYLITNEDNMQSLQARAEMSVSTYPSINPEDLLNINFILPSKEILLLANTIFQSHSELSDRKKKEIKLLRNMKELLLSKLATIEN